jgi:hypothetical protein
MLRAFARLAVVAVTALTLTVVAVPTADARPLAVRTAPSVEQSWFAAAWSWLSTLVPAVASPATGRVHSSAEATQLTLSPGGLIGDLPEHPAHPMTGSCMDPWGHMTPCNQ